ncbi:C-type lectin 1 [Elysia marginata]|uniref:C-type lectin 1 n=1 Tax=Elysia marginata TaxID=1093978 RepID=A0AAV4F7E4_9GAST|nr:C-type lectin 1 [Elysia marginata]
MTNRNRTGDMTHPCLTPDYKPSAVSNAALVISIHIGQDVDDILWNSILPDEIKLTRVTWGECQALQLGSSWKTPSLMTCFIACLTRYPSDCKSIVYNKDTSTCIPASKAFRPIAKFTSSIPDNDPKDAIIYSRSAPQCQTNLGFALYDVCGTSACLYVSAGRVNYQAAVDECEARNSTLFVADSIQKFSLFWFVSREVINDNTFLGLSDSQTEGRFVWANGNYLNSEQNGYIWETGQPDHGPDENCAQAKHRYWRDAQGLDDVTCASSSRFICEYGP